MSADYRTLLWALVFMPACLIAQIMNPKLVPYLAPVSVYLAISCGNIAHNHNHCPVFASKGMNAFFSIWISIFYGYPAFAWIPTHNLNHHRYVNREGDATITWRHTNRNTWYVALSYYFISAYYQSVPIKDYIRKAKTNNPKLYRQIILQYFFWGAAIVGVLAICLGLHGVKTGLTVFGFAFFLPGFIGPWTMMWFNYMQHVHTDPWSKHHHSRDITGRLFNFLLFNNGLHTVHHENAGMHWSKAWEAHAKVAKELHPDLVWKSFTWWIVRGYVIPAFFKSLETKQVGRAPFDKKGTGQGDDAPPPAVNENGERPFIDSVEALEAGSNAQMA